MAATAGGEEIRNFETETEVLGLYPITFIDLVINAVNDYCYDTADAILEFVQQALPDADPGLLRTDVNTLLMLVQDAVDKYFDKFELYCLSNIFSVPEKLALPTDLSSGEEAVDQKEEIELDQELVDLRRQIRTEQHLNHELKKEVAKLKDSTPVTTQIEHTRTEIKKALKAAKVPALPDNIEFLGQQVVRLLKAGPAVSAVIKKGVRTSKREASDMTGDAAAEVKRLKGSAVKAIPSI